MRIERLQDTFREIVFRLVGNAALVSRRYGRRTSARTAGAFLPASHRDGWIRQQWLI